MDISGWDSYAPNQPEPLNENVKVIATGKVGDLEKPNPELKALIDGQFEYVRGKWSFKQWM